MRVKTIVGHGAGAVVFVLTVGAICGSVVRLRKHDHRSVSTFKRGVLNFHEGHFILAFGAVVVTIVHVGKKDGSTVIAGEGGEFVSVHVVVGFIFTVHAVFVTVVDIMAVDFHTIVTDEFLNNDWFIRSVGAVIHAVVYRCEGHGCTVCTSVGATIVLYHRFI